MTITTRLCRSNKIGSKFIQAFTSGEWSHCIIEVNGNWYQAKMLHGVVCTNKEEEAIKGQDVWEDRIIECTEEEFFKAEEFLKAQVGKPYDWGGAKMLPFIKSEGWQKDNKWFCSELVYATYIVMGFQPFIEKYAKHISPQHLAMINYMYRKI